MRTAFVETENVRRFHGALSALERRGAEEACLMVVDGSPGLGKTTAFYRWVAESQAVYLRACAEWTPSWFLSDLLGALRIAPEHSFQKRFAQAMEQLLLRQSDRALQGKPFAVVIDEADHVSRNRRIMETIRDFSDSGNIVFVLVGMGKIRDNLVRYPQIASRIGQYVRFDPMELSDVAKFLSQKCEVPVDAELAKFVHRVTEGYNREVMEAVMAIERFGRRNGHDAEHPVRLADMAGEHLINARRTGMPVRVPETCP